ncbi:MAG: hypothetical protein EBT03_12240, partial [Betaproteobacteria bacterium]|nr:hypothetical protein [Betaproteobacteria bacterium]
MRMTMGSKQQRPISLGLQVCAALGAVCALAGSVCAQGISLDMGGATLKMEPESAQEELAVGRLVAGQILGAAKLLPNAELQRYVNLVGRRVADQSERKDAAWAFGVIDSSAINAFAGPGGKILITSALL